MAQSDLVLFTVADHVALITVNDPDRRNAVTAEMSARLREAVERAEADSDVHADRIAPAEKSPRNSFADDRHLRTFRRVARREFTPGKQRNSHR